MEISSLLILIAIVISAIAFVVLVIFLVIALLQLKRSLQRTDQLIEETNEIAENVHDKLEAFDPLFNYVKNISHSLEKGATSRKVLAKEIAEDLYEEEEELEKRGRANSVLELVEWGMEGLSLILSLRKKTRGRRR